MKKLLLLLLAVFLLPQGVLADSISPDTFTATLNVGESVTIAKTVTISETPSAARLDVNFLFDTTGSMGDLIGAAQTSATAITTSLSALGDVTFGVGTYEDFYVGYETEGWGGLRFGDPDVPYAQITDQTSAAGAIAAINSLSLGNGNDIPESNLYGLQQTATQTTWRDDSTRVIVWFGDARGHDPDTTTGYPGPTLAQTISALTGEDIVVVAIDLRSMNSIYGQVDAIINATGGSKYTGAVDATTITDLITGLVTDIFASYSEVTLLVDGAPAGVTVDWDPLTYLGDFDRSVERTFDFDVTFTGVSAGVYDFSIHALADGRIIATERDSITVRGTAVPEPGTVFLLGAGLLGLGVARRRNNRK